MGEHSENYSLEFLSSLNTDDLLAKYELCSNDDERFILALETIIHNASTLFDPQCEKKNTQHSIRSRENGNKSFMGGQYYRAVEKYTESIVYAVDSSEELALAYANRSAALFKLEKHADCVDDIDRALKLNLPDKSRSKLFKRKGLCHTTLGKPGAESFFHEALVWLEKMNLSKGEMNEHESELKKLIAAPRTVPKVSKDVMQPALPKILTPNSEVPSASDAVAIKYSKKFGRYLVATRNIKPGEIMIVEKPYCLRLIPSNVYTHCSYCLQVSWNLIACKGCVNVAYCSEACRDKAWDAYHEVECPIVGLLLCFKFNNTVWISLRTAIIATKKGMNLNAVKEELTSVDLNTDARTKGYGEDGKFHSDQWRSIYSLANNADKCSTEYLLSRALIVATIAYILATESLMFGEKLNVDTLAKNPDVIFVGTMILKHVYAITINAHSFGSSRTESHSEHGHALMAVCSLLNHSCDSNALKQWYVDRLVWYAGYPIKQGEQIFDCYGPRFLTTEKSEREEHLKSWHLNCECRACTENWPLAHKLPSYQTQPLTRQNKSKLDNFMRKFARNNLPIKKAFEKNPQKTLSKLLELIEVLFQLAQRPCAELSMAVAMLKEYYAVADAVFHYEPVVY